MQKFREAVQLFAEMAADTVKWPINLELSCDKQGVRHVEGQLGEDGGGGGAVQIGPLSR